MNRRPRMRHLLGSSVLALVAGVLFAASAGSHPFGPPQRVTLSAEADQVTVVWRFGAADDLMLTGVDLGIIPKSSFHEDGTIDLDPATPRLMAEAEAMHAYLLEQISVEQSGTACTGSVGSSTDIETEGLPAVFECPGEVTEVDVRVEMLLDQDERYRTHADGPFGQAQVYDDDDRVHTWAFTEGAVAGADDRRRSAVLQIGAVLVVLVAGGVGAGWWLRRRRDASAPAVR